MNVKNMIIINATLLVLCYVIPKPQINVQLAETEIENQEIVTVERQEITNRSKTDRKEVVKNYIVNDETDLRTKSNMSIEEYQKMLENTALYEIAESLYNAEQKFGVNGLYLMGLACLESFYGNSNFAKNRNNIFGWNAVDSNPGKASYFTSKNECVMFVAEKLSNNYLSENGCYFEGYTAKDIDKHYCTDKQHANKIIKIIEKLEKNLTNNM